MIKSITMKNIGSYKEETRLETDKRINLIFGFNGTGKTFLSKNIKLNNDNIEWHNQNIDMILTFNTDYILKNFYELDNYLEPVFYIGQNPNVIKLTNELKENINNLEKEILKLKSEKVSQDSDMKKLNDDMLDKVWELKQYYEKQNYGDLLLKKLNKRSKMTFFDSFKDIECKYIDNNISITEICNKLENLKKPTTTMTLLPYIQLPNIKVIITNNIFLKVITGNKNSKIAEYIEQLNNAEWVKVGYENYVSTDTQKCPFCHSNTITDSFIESLKDFFDTSYKKDIEYIGELYKSFKHEINIINKDIYIDNKFIINNLATFENLYNTLIKKLNHILGQISNKLQKPNVEIYLDNIDIELDELNKFITNINVLIEQENQEIINKEQTINQLVNDFWSIKRFELKNYIETGMNMKNNYKEKIEKIDSTISNKENDLIKLTKQYQDNMTNFKDIKKAKKNINKQLEYMGLDYFYIDDYIDETITDSSEEDKFKYKLIRKDQNNNNNQNFTSFSEGEKMIISFLYFIEQCKSEAKKNNIIIVIDDPISSLSNNNLFEIAFIIRRLTENNTNQTNNMKQFFILTHNIYFFDELRRTLKKNDSKTFQIYRKANGSIIGDLQSKQLYKYLTYWQVYRDITIGKKVDKILLANTMRNILEFFYHIILRDDIQKLENDEKYSSLYRFTNKETHIVTDEDETFSQDRFITLFEQLFIDKNYKHHFDAMIRESK